MIWTDYYRIPTIDGNFYLYQKKQNYQHDYKNEIDRLDLTEAITGLKCSICINSIYVPTDLVKFKLLKPELLKSHPDLKHYLEFKKFIDYTSLSFNKDILEYVIDYYDKGDNIDHILKTNIDNYKCIDRSEFKEGINNIIRSAGSEERAQDEIINKLRKRKELFMINKK